MAADSTSSTFAPNPDNYPFDPYTTPGVHELVVRMQEAETISDWADIFVGPPGDATGVWNRPLLRFGNNKIASDVAIFNVCAATDCKHLGSDRCQVPKEQCYAYRNEQDYTNHQSGQWANPLNSRRQQMVLWHHMSPRLFAETFNYVISERKRTDITAFRFNESGDVATQQELRKIDRIAELIDDSVQVYLYTASSGLDWSEAEHVTVNASNDDVLAQDGVRGRFDAVPTADDIPDDGIQCPYDYSDGDIECGSCRLCISDDIDRDVYVTQH